MSYTGSGGDDQSEDGELRHSPSEIKTKEEILDFRLVYCNVKRTRIIIVFSSLSEEDQDTADSLDIKPPQASRVQAASSSRTKRRDRTREGRSHRSRSDRHREERSHGHRERKHREHRNEHRDNYREKEHFYREKEAYMKSEGYRDVRYDPNVYKEIQYRESRHEGSSRDVRIGYESREKKAERYSEKEIRYMQEMQKSRKYEERQERRAKAYSEQALDDLRERLLIKHRNKETDDYKHYDKERRRGKVENDLEDPETYVKEIIDLSTEELKDRKEKHHHHRRERERDRESDKEEKLDWEKEEEKLEQAERNVVLDPEQELRKEKLLEAGTIGYYL